MAHGLLYNPSNWYWNVAKSATQVYSSASAAYVPISNPAYVAWLSKGNAPTKIAVEADLWGVLAAQHPTGLPAANATAQAAVKTKQANDIPPAVLKVFMDHENRIRAMQKPVQTALTAATFQTYVKGL